MRRLLLLPNQLFYRLVPQWKKDYDEVVLVEHPKFFTGGKTKLRIHYMKLLYHRITMQLFFKHLTATGLSARYIDHASYKLPSSFTIYNPWDHEITKEITSSRPSATILPDSPLFPISLASIQHFKDYPSIRHTQHFYKWVKQQDFMRAVRIGNKNYDKENRKPFPRAIKDNPESIDPLTDYSQKHSKEVVAAINYVRQNFRGHWGMLEADSLVFPLDREQALAHFRNFVQHKLPLFGPYQDAFHSDILIGNHSGISMALNIGIISTEECLALLPRAAPIASLEGFVRQLVSWRCYVAMLYILHADKFKPPTAGIAMPKSFYTATTSIAPLDEAIQKAYQFAYLHHIERLMVVGNVMLLCMVRRKDVYRWFMECVSIDAYEWVMVPNIYGMSQYVTNFMTTRPYIASSNYLLKMSNHKPASSSWAATLDALYYNYIEANKEQLKKEYVGASAVAAWNRKSAEQRRELLSTAKRFLHYRS